MDINIPYEEPSAAWTKLEKMTKTKIDRPRLLVLALRRMKHIELSLK